MSKERFKLTTAINLLLRRDNQILLLKRNNTGNQDGMYSIIAGHLEQGELGTTAIAREAREEAGITIEPADIKFVHLVQRLPKDDTQEEYLDIFYEAWVWQGEPSNNEPEKCSELVWCKVDDLPDTTIPLLPIVINDISNGINYSEYSEEPV